LFSASLVLVLRPLVRPRACQRTLSWSRHGCLSYPARASGPVAACADFCPHSNAGLVWPWYACADGCHRRLRCHRIHYWSWRLVDAFWGPLRVCTCRAAAASDLAAKHFLVFVVSRATQDCERFTLLIHALVLSGIIITVSGSRFPILIEIILGSFTLGCLELWQQNVGERECERDTGGGCRCRFHVYR